MDESKKIDLLLAEYLQLQKNVEDFDARALTIKAWSVTLSAAGIVAAYVEGQQIILLIAAISALAFWLVEALWKTSQQAFYLRIRRIENAFSADVLQSIHPLQIASSWSESWHAGRNSGKLFQVMLWPHVFLPHFPVAISGVAFLLFLPPTG